MDSFFRDRLISQGWEIDGFDEPTGLVQESWSAIQHLYGGGLVRETPLTRAPWLEDHEEGFRSVRLKLESEQATGSFKARGAANALRALTDAELVRGVVTASTGNHGLAVSHAARVEAERRGLTGRARPPRVFVSASALPERLERIRAAGAEVVVVAEATDSSVSEARARETAEREGAVFVSPYNHPSVAGGQGTLAIEVLQSLRPSDLDVVFVPVGGGGLISGVAAVLKRLAPGVRVVGCSPSNSDVLARSVLAGVEHPLDELDPPLSTLSDATAGGVERGSLTLPAARLYVDEWLAVPERDIASAMRLAKIKGGIDIEGAAAVTLAALIGAAPDYRGRSAVAVISGGNVTKDTLAAAERLLDGAPLR